MAFAQVGMVDSDIQIELEALRLFRLPDVHTMAGPAMRTQADGRSRAGLLGARDEAIALGF